MSDRSISRSGLPASFRSFLRFSADSLVIYRSAAALVGQTPGLRGSPRTRCSLEESSACHSRIAGRGPAADEGVRPTIDAGGLLFFGHHDGDFGGDIFMQPHGDLELAQLFDGFVQLDLAAVDDEVLSGQCVGHILGGDGAEQLVVLAGFLFDGDGDAVDQPGQILRLDFEFGVFAQVRLALLFDDLLVGGGGCNGEAFGQQEIAGVSGGNFDYLAAGAQFVDIFSQYDFHDSFLVLLELRREGQQRDVAGFLDGVGEAALVGGADARDTARDNLAPLRDEGVQHLDVLVVDVVNLFDAEAANLLAAKVLFFLGGDGFIAAGGPLSGAAWSTFEFWHGLILLRHAGHDGRPFGDGLRRRWSGSRRGGRAREIALNLDALSPQVALPHRVDHVEPIAQAAGTPVQMVYLGTCTGGRVKDFHEARGVQLVVTPASRAVMETLAQDGTLADFVAMGAVVVTPGCGSCCGTCGAIPGDGVNVISTANRNFKGRMGNSGAFIYLASSASCAAAAVRGSITDPREIDP